VNTYLSMKQAGFSPGQVGFLKEWPDNWIADLPGFARLWNEMALSWAAVADRLGVTWIRYEDLMDGRIDILGLGQSLGLALNPEPALAVRAGGAFAPAEMTAQERDEINAITAPGRRFFAYDE